MLQFADWVLPASVRVLLQRAVELAATVPTTVFGLASKADVEFQSRLTRRKTTTALKEILEAQRAQAERLEQLSAELREELQSFATAMNDQLFALERATPSRRAALDEFDDEDDEDDEDDLDLMSYDELFDDDSCGDDSCGDGEDVDLAY